MVEYKGKIYYDSSEVPMPNLDDNSPENIAWCDEYMQIMLLFHEQDELEKQAKQKESEE